MLASDERVDSSSVGSVHKRKLRSYISKSVVKNYCLLPKQFNCGENRLEDYHCFKCGFKTDILVILKQHIRQNHDEVRNPVIPIMTTSLVCRNCDFETYSRLLWLKHLKSECGYTQPIESEVKGKKHVKVARSYECEYCHYKSRFYRNIRRHVHFRHTNPEDIKWHQCDYCNFRTKTKYQLKRHTYNKHHVESDNETKKEQTAVEKKKKPPLHLDGVKCYFCDHCRYKTINKTNFDSHILRQHRHPDAIKWFKCEQCEYKAKSRHEVQRHVTYRHTNLEEIDWHKCDHCDFKAKTKSHLASHLVIHKDDIKWHKCGHCDYKTYKKWNLDQHIVNMHTIKWLKCELCDYKAKVPQVLKRHMLSRHTNPKNIKWQECCFCGHKAETEAKIRWHVLSEHLEGDTKT